MKILIISLLRIGDLLSHLKAIEIFNSEFEYFENQQPIELYILTHRTHSNFSAIAPWVEKFFYFDRELVQKSQKENFLPFNSGLSHSKSLLNEMNQISFDHIFNFTNTKISALWMNEINSKYKIGLNSLDNRFFVNDPSGWFFYLNNTNSSQFNFIDIFRLSMQKNLQNSLHPKSPHNKMSNLIYNKNKNQTHLKKKTITFQLITSDNKKNGNPHKWKKLLSELKIHLYDYEFKILCAQSELNAMQNNFGSILSDSKITIIPCTFHEAFILISQSQLLVTLDTSIKHLATFTDTPIFEIPLGSSNPIETGAYSINSYMYYKPLTCQPCKHSSICDLQYECHNQLDFHELHLSILYILNSNKCAQTLTITDNYPFTNSISRLSNNHDCIQTKNFEIKNLYKAQFLNDSKTQIKYLNYKKLAFRRDFLEKEL